MFSEQIECLIVLKFSYTVTQLPIQSLEFWEEILPYIASVCV